MDKCKKAKVKQTKFNVQKEAEQIFGEMREATTDEELMVRNYIDSISESIDKSFISKIAE